MGLGPLMAEQGWQEGGRGLTAVVGVVTVVVAGVAGQECWWGGGGASSGGRSVVAVPVVAGV